MFDIYEPKFWVTAAFVLFLAISAKKLFRLMVENLDKRSDRIKSELDAARALRAEAEEILALYKRKQLEFSKEAENILAKARHDTEAAEAHAQAELKAVLDARLKQSLEKIVQEEASAISEVRNRIVDLAITAAHNVITEQTAGSSSDELIKLTISDIEHKLH